MRYEFTRPLNHVSRLERDLEVSHWGGNVATEERYELVNAGARLSRHFDRAAWASTAYFSPATNALRELRFPLRAGSSDPYFTDDIGNVSTSHFRSNLREASLELRPRYPVFGAWRYKFRVGWNADLKDYLRRLDSAGVAAVNVPKAGHERARDGEGKGKGPVVVGGYVLKVPFLEGPKQPEGIEYEKVVVRIILPEGATDVRYQFPSEPAGISLVAAELTSHRSFMDTVGRTTLVLEAVNLVDENRGSEIYVRG